VKTETQTKLEIAEILVKHLGNIDVSEAISPLQEYIEKQLHIGDVSTSDLAEIIKSDSVYTLLRFGFKSPSKSGMDDCDDIDYAKLYRLVCELRKH